MHREPTLPDFDVTISHETLRRYLSRAVTYANTLSFVPPEDDLRMIREIGALFLGRCAYEWVPVMDDEEHYRRAEAFAARVHAMNPRIICQGAVFEAVYPGVERISVPAWVFAEFGEPVERRTFRYGEMAAREFASLYPWKQFGSEHGMVPDLTARETQRYFYYRARRYIDAGYEALHLGQPHLYGGRDRGMAIFDELCGRIRAHARRAARRRLVLLDAHTHGIARGGRLLLDFHSRPISARAWREQPERIILQFKGTSLGGVAPSGWSCARLPYLIEFDNWGGLSLDPAAWADLDRRAGAGRWGWDDIAWFAHQPEDERNHFLRYAHRWLGVQDPDAFLQLPARRLLGDASVNFRCADGITRTVWHYRANRPSQACLEGFGQEDTIRSIWAEPEPPWLSDWHAAKLPPSRPEPASTQHGQDVPDTVVLVGSVQTILGGGVGHTLCPYSRMCHVGGGRFELAAVIPWPGEYTAAVAVGGTMTEVYRRGGMAGGSEYRIRTTEPAQRVRFSFDYATRILVVLDDAGRSLLVE
jgi:hypothetical protein